MKAKANGATKKRKREKPNLALRARSPRVRAKAKKESRKKQVSAAVYASEIPLFSEAARREGRTKSDIMRDSLVRVAEKHAIVEPVKKPRRRSAR